MTGYDWVVHPIADNLLRLHRHEETIRAKSLEAVAASAALADHLRAVHDAADHLNVLLQVKATPGDDQHTAQLFVIRLFNVGASALKLGLSGYYQQAFHLLRDSLELVNLVDLFAVEPNKISEWRLADDKTLRKSFGPAAVRQALDGHTEYVGQEAERARLYALFSGHAAHMTYKGFNLVAPGNSPRMGPFFDEKLLRALMEDMGKHLSHAALGLGLLFEDVEMPILEGKAAYLETLKRYHEKYIKRSA